MSRSKPATSVIELSELSELVDHEVMREVAHALTLARLVEGLTALPDDHASSVIDDLTPGDRK